jgi:hypothetical protein
MRPVRHPDRRHPSFQLVRDRLAAERIGKRHAHITRLRHLTGDAYSQSMGEVRVGPGLSSNTEAIVGVELDAIPDHDQRALELHLGAGRDRDQRYLVRSPLPVQQIRDGLGAIAAGAEGGCCKDKCRDGRRIRVVSMSIASEKEEGTTHLHISKERQIVSERPSRRS